MTAIGQRIIHEGDVLFFNKQKVVAFYTDFYNFGGINIRIVGYDYGSDPENCHTYRPESLTKHIPLERQKTGFGRFICQIEG